jgi:hypothetical protein
MQDDDVARLWRFRLRFVNLKPEIDPADDFAAFRRGLRNATQVTWCEDDAGEIATLISLRLFDWRYLGAPRRGILGETAFVDPAHRGTAFGVFTFALATAKMLWKAGQLDVWYGGVACLQSSVAFARYVGDAYFLGEHCVPDEARAFLEEVAEQAGVVPEPSGHVVTKTLPPKPPPGWLERHGDDVVTRRYLAHNPHWDAEGTGLVIGARVGLPLLASTGPILVRRAVGRERKSS